MLKTNIDMDSVFYDWIKPGTKVVFIRSSVEQPFIWTLFEGYVARAYDLDKRYYYQCTISNIIASENWVAEYVANKTYRLTSIEDGHQENVMLYHDTTKGQTFLEAWKQWWHSKWLFDLTADLVFVDSDTTSAKCKAIQMLSTIYLTNSNTFQAIEQICSKQLLELR